MVCNTCVHSLIDISTTINQLKIYVSLTTIYRLRFFVVVVASEEMVSETCVPSFIIVNNKIKQLEINASLITLYCLRLFVVYNHVMSQGQR